MSRAGLQDVRALSSTRGWGSSSEDLGELEGEDGQSSQEDYLSRPHSLLH